MRLLFLASNPRWTPTLDIDDEIRELRQELKSVTYRDNIDLEVRSAIRLDDLVPLVREIRPDIIHFSGHGNERGLLLSGTSNKSVDGKKLAEFLQDRGVKLVVFNACYSADHAREVANTVPTVVGTPKKVGDLAAKRFCLAFYRVLGNGGTIADALRDARDTLKLFDHKEDFLTFGDLDKTLVSVDQGDSSEDKSEGRADSALRLADRATEQVAIFSTGLARVSLIAIVIGLIMSLAWRKAYPSNPLSGELYTVFGLFAVMLGTAVEFAIRKLRRK